MSGAISSQQGRLPVWLLQAAFWIGTVTLFWGLDTLTKLDERERLVRSLALQIPGSLLFALGHYGLLVVLRIVVFHANGLRYVYQHDHLENLVFEYRKDIKIYLAMVGIISVYGLIVRHRAEQRATRAGFAVGGKMLVQTGSGERLIDVTQIDYLQAARNYVSVYVSGKEYIVRDTLSNLEARLAAGESLRSHRGFLVNANRIVAIEPTRSGAHEILLANDARIPLSRSFRDAARDFLRRAGESASEKVQA